MSTPQSTLPILNLAIFPSESEIRLGFHSKTTSDHHPMPEHEYQIPPNHILCQREGNVDQNLKWGPDHDHEGLSYVSKVSFLIIDLFRLSAITVDVGEKTACAWAQPLVLYITGSLREARLLYWCVQ